MPPPQGDEQSQNWPGQEVSELSLPKVYLKRWSTLFKLKTVLHLQAEYGLIIMYSEYEIKQKVHTLETPFGHQLSAVGCPYLRRITSIGPQMECPISPHLQLLLHTFDGSVIERWTK